MEDWKVGDKVGVYEYDYQIGVGEIAEITEGGGVRLQRDAATTFTEDRKGRMSCGWYYLRKITDTEFEDYLCKRELKIKCSKIISRLTSIKDKELLNYEQAIEIFYDKLIEDKPQ